MIYLITLVMICFCIYLYDIGNFKYSKDTALVIILMTLILTAGLSYRVGIDAMRYSDEFLSYPKFRDLSTFDFSTSSDDPLWIVFSAFFRSISSDFVYLHLAHALIVNSIIFYFIRTYSPYIFTTVLLYYLIFYLFFNFETLRESLAVAVSLLSFRSLSDKKWVTYFLISTIAFFIHSSAFFVFLIPFVLRLMRMKAWLPILFIVAGVFIMGRYINEVVLNLLPLIQLNERIVYKLTVYFGRDAIGISTGIFLKNVFFPLVLLLIDRFALKKNSEFTPFTKMFLVVGCISLVIPVVDRLLNYLFVIYIIHVTQAIGGVAQLFETRVVKFYVLGFFIICFTFGPLSWLFTIDDRIDERNYNRYFPYSSYPFQEKYEVREKFYRNGS